MSIKQFAALSGGQVVGVGISFSAAEDDAVVQPQTIRECSSDLAEAYRRGDRIRLGDTEVLKDILCLVRRAALCEKCCAVFARYGIACCSH